MSEPPPQPPVDHDPLKWRAQSLNSAGFFALLQAVLEAVPEDLNEQLGEVVTGWVAHYLPAVQTALAANLAVTAPGRAPAEYRAMALETVVHYSLGVKDYLLQSAGKLSRFRMDGEPSPGVRDMIEIGRGFILVSAHLGNFELGSALIQRYGLNGAIVALPEEIAAIDALRVGTRRNFGVDTLAVGTELDTFLRARRRLEQGGVLAMLVERHLPGNAVPVQFFGRTCHFLRSPAQLARLSGVPLVPVAVHRVGQSAYRLECGDPIRVPGTRREEDLVAAMQQVANFFEGWIRRHPDQWFNFYDYFAAAARPD